MEPVVVELVQNQLESFGVREFPSFMKWMREQWEANPRTLLSMNPPNHAHDVEDGSMDIALGREAVELKLKAQQNLAGTVFSFKVRKEDTGSRFRFLGKYEPSNQLKYWGSGRLIRIGKRF